MSYATSETTHLGMVLGSVPEVFAQIIPNCLSFLTEVTSERTRQVQHADITVGEETPYGARHAVPSKAALVRAYDLPVAQNNLGFSPLLGAATSEGEISTGGRRTACRTEHPSPPRSSLASFMKAGVAS